MLYRLNITNNTYNTGTKENGSSYLQTYHIVINHVCVGIHIFYKRLKHYPSAEHNISNICIVGLSYN